MSNFRTKVMDRFLSVLLTLVMVVGMLPVTVFASAADYEGKYVITVTDSKGPVISEANIEYKIKVDSLEQNSGSVKTDSEGMAGIDLSNYQNDFNDKKQITISYTVTKDDYNSKTGEIAVENITGKSEIKMEAITLPAEQVTVTVNVIGKGSVKLNGEDKTNITVNKGEDVEFELTPAKNCYIKSLIVDGVDKTVNAEKGKPYSDTINPQKTTEISVTFTEEFTVSVSANDGGTIKLDGDEKNFVTVDEGSTVHLDVTANEGYQISSIMIDSNLETIDKPYTYEKDIIVNSDVSVNIVFVKEYVITVKCDDNGNVVTSPENTAGSVTIKENETLTVTATPKENYRVSVVTVTGEDPETFQDNDKKYSREFKTNEFISSSIEINITFALNRFSVKGEISDNFTITVQNELVNYNDETTAEITANGNYNIKEIRVNDDPVPFDRTSDRTVEITLNKIMEDQVISVLGEPIQETAEFPTDIAAFKDSAIRTNEESGLYVYEKDAAVTFNTNYDGIAVNEITDDGVQFKTNSVTISETTTITSIYLYYENVWHKVTPKQPIKIVIDNETVIAPQLTPDNPHANDYYNKDFNVAVVAKDTGDYSGIAKVEYWVTSEVQPGIQKKTQKGTLYTYDGGEILDIWAEKPIVVDTKLSNSDKVIVNVQVTDRAGNQSDVATREVKVNSTPPEISVEIDGTPHTEAEKGYYNTKRTATVTYTDRASTFDQNAAEEGIDIKAFDGNKEPVFLNKKAMISWENNGDQHIATIDFSTDANYEWSISYKNKSGLFNEKIVDVTGEFVYEFTVDTEAPSSATIEIDGDTWSKILPSLTFGLWKNYSVTATVTETKDAISPVKEALYYKDAGESILSVF